MPRHRKKMRKSRSNDDVKDEGQPGADVFSQLPLELLGDILNRVSSKEVLAVARCSQFLCHTLVNNPATLYIWKNARLNCLPSPVPEPTNNFTESSYASFIFDGGSCEYCGKITSDFYKSFSLRLRVCDKKCFASWKSSDKSITPSRTLDNLAVMRWLPCLEENSITYFRQADFWKEFRNFKRIAHASPGGSDAYTLIHSSDERKKKEIMKLSTTLRTWVNTRVGYEDRIRTDILRFCRRMAEKEGWNFWSLRNAPSFDALAVSCQRALRVPREKDFLQIKNTVIAEITTAQLRFDRRVEELQYARRREIIKKLYLELKTENGRKEAFPVLALFRSLPVVSSLQNKEGKTESELLKEIYSPNVKMLIRNDLSTWRDVTNRKFSKLLGFKDYRSISTKKLHPLDRLTSRFNCLKCRVHYAGIRSNFSDVVLDYKQACSHVCKFILPQLRDGASWTVEQFTVDTKAADATQLLLGKLGYCEDEIESIEKVTALGARISCLSCEGFIIMDFRTLQEHCHRHPERCQLSIDEGGKKRKIPFVAGLCSTLLSYEKSAQKKHSLRIFGCCHCLAREEGDVLSSEDMSTGSVDSLKEASEAQNKPKTSRTSLMTFNGARSHLKAKHNILNISDEDIYCDEN